MPKGKGCGGPGASSMKRVFDAVNKLTSTPKSTVDTGYGMDQIIMMNTQHPSKAALRASSAILGSRGGLATHGLLKK